jgi:outer membrane lipopolysaccharide assembly protein LptE/RlpB
MIRPNSISRLLTVALLACLPLCTGCGYRVGARSLFPPNIRTVRVEMFRSDTLRRNLGEWLTEAVVKQIEQVSPMKVVNHANADSVLTGRIIRVTKSVVGETINDDPRDIELDMLVEVTWYDRGGNLLCEPMRLPLTPSVLSAGQSANFVPEAGQSVATAEQQVITHLARQIVGRMERPW